MKKAVCPGSFNPVTNGHVDVIKRAAELFDEVTVLIMVNPDKECIFSPDERAEMMKTAVSGIKNVKVDIWDGLLAAYVEEKGICAIVKGLRSATDFDYEFQMALANKSLAPGAETVFLTAKPENMYVSSTLVRQIASFGGDIKDFVPKEICDIITDRCKR